MGPHSTTSSGRSRQSRLRTGTLGTSSGRSLQSRMKTGHMPGMSGGVQQPAFLPSTHDVTVSDRPVTGAGGITGMKISSKGSLNGREVHDANYYTAHLRAKEAAIVEEIARLRSETEKMQREVGDRTKIESRFDDALTEVRDLEGTLADYNLAIDKARSGTDPEEIHRLQKNLAARNQKLAGEIDDMFLSKKSIEKDTARLEREIADIHYTIEEKVEKMDPIKLRIYQDLMRQIQDLHLVGRRREDELEGLKSKISTLEANMRGMELRGKYEAEEKKLAAIETKLSQLREDLELEAMSPKESHAYLLNKVKDDQQRSSDLDKKGKELDKEISRLKGRQRDLQVEMGAKKVGDETNTESLFEKDRQVTSFLESFDNEMAQISQEQMRTKDTIAALLEDLSGSIIATRTEMPSHERMEQLKDDVSFKAKQLETNQQTLAKLRDQKLKRMQEVEKVKTLEGKIEVELKQLNESMDAMKTEMDWYDDLRTLQDNAEATKDRLLQMSEEYVARIGMVEGEVKKVSARYEKGKSELEGNETWKSLENLERKLRQQGQNIFELQEFVETKRRQTDFESIKDDCLRTVETLNSMAAETA